MIACLLSGGVDSSVALFLLKEAGFEPQVFYIKIGMEDEKGFLDCNFKEDIENVHSVCKFLGLKAEIVSLHEDYWEKVISYTIETVKSGQTPNPDIMCNKLIKFGVFEERYGHHYDKIATGHYANIIENENGFFLATAIDQHKDQTYFLSQLDQKQVSRISFPIGNIKKPEVRSIANKLDLSSANRPDSQGICFLGKINYRDFLARYVGIREGKIIDHETGKILGKHNGFWFYTIGQRQGLGLSQGPWFVVKKDTFENIIYVSNGYDPESQYQNVIKLEDFHLINPSGSKLLNNQKIKFKIRHTPEFSDGVIYLKDKNHLEVTSAKKIAGVAPGQFGVIYDEHSKICLGSGVIN